MGSKNKLPEIPTKESMVSLFENMLYPIMAIACFVAIVCGLRVSEVAKLQIDDVDIERRIIKVKDSKWKFRKKDNYGKDRIVPIPVIAVSPIKKWLSIVKGSKWFLPSVSNNEGPLKTKTLQAWFFETRRRTGLNQPDQVIPYKNPTKYRKCTTVYKIRFHTFRHYYATYVYEKTRDLYAVSNLLGHESVATTQVYAKVSDKIKKETVDFAFDTPIRTQVFERNPIAAVNYNIPEIAKKDKTPFEVLNDKLARGEISEIEYRHKISLIKLAREHLENNSQLN